MVINLCRCQYIVNYLGTFSMIIGIALINPSASPIIRSIPLCTSIGRFSIKVDTKVNIASTAAGISSGKACLNPLVNRL